MEEKKLGSGKKSDAYPVLFEHNIFIIWNPEYNLGIPIIDEQHRGIVTIINSLHFEMQRNNTKDILTSIIDMMNDYTHIHFFLEESFLEKIDFPNVKRHHELHRDLSFKLTDAGRKSMLDKDPYKFMDFLKSWWINHICSEDLAYRNYLISGK